jgi:pimeloyl-ACP methyl ester carboxylesterase
MILIVVHGTGVHDTLLNIVLGGGQAAYYRHYGLYSHMAYPMEGLKRVLRMGRDAKRNLLESRIPVCILYGGSDSLISERCVNALKQTLHDHDAGRVVVTHRIPYAGHILTVEPGRECGRP